jgi:PII-like signaling protein
MLHKGPAKRVIISINEDARYHHAPLHDALMQFLLHKGVAGATLTRAAAGFGSHGVLHTTKVEALAQHLPVRIEFVESPDRVDQLLPTLYDMVGDGLVEVQDTLVVKAASSSPPRQALPKAPGDAAAPPLPERVRHRREGPARLMRVFLGEADRLDNEPLYDAIVKRLRLLDIAGATVYRGILGYGAKGHTHKLDFFHLSRDLPIVISVIDSPEKIAEAASAVEQMMDDGLIVLSDVEMVRLVHSDAG